MCARWIAPAMAGVSISKAQGRLMLPGSLPGPVRHLGLCYPVVIALIA